MKKKGLVPKVDFRSTEENKEAKEIEIRIETSITTLQLEVISS